MLKDDFYIMIYRGGKYIVQTIEILDKIDCCGCSSCMQKCPKNAITMEENEEGFLYPKIDKKKCIECGICVKVCSQLSYTVEKKENYPIAYACYNKKDDELIKSSSGGVFSAIANYVLEKKGFIIGAAFDENLVLKHICVNTKKDLEKLRGSKYLQSNINYMYKVAEEKLKDGNIVFFTGTSCQIAGLKTYLMKDYDNLITADILCHGVPNQKIFSKYIEYIEDKYNSKVKNYLFRTKEQNGWGEYIAKIELNNGKIKFKNSVIDQYYNAFLACNTYRESCYKCKYTSINRVSDISMADYWVVWSIHPKIKKKKGISLMLVNTEKGKKIIECISEKMECIETNLDKAVQKNMNLKKPTSRPKERDKIYRGINEKSARRFIKENLKIKITPKTILKIILPDKVKMLIRKVRVIK